MSDENDDRLARIIARKQAENAQRQKNEAVLLNQREQERQAVETVIQTWYNHLPMIEQVINKINAKLLPIGLHLNFETKEGDKQPVVVVGEITANADEDHRKRSLTLNVHRNGEVRWFIQTPKYTTTTPKSFNIADADSGQYEAVIVEFVDQAT